MIYIKDLKLVSSKAELGDIPEENVLINTVNAFSYNNARKEELFAETLMKGDYLIPVGASIVAVWQQSLMTKSASRFH